MNHIYDNGEMTFGELKQLLQSAVDGKLRGTEKTDGQNVFLSFDVATQKARAIRNKTHIKAGGLTVEEFDDFFSAHPNQALRYSFVEALQAFEDVMLKLDKETQLKIFGRKEDNIYFNTEVMNPGNPSAEEGDPSGLGTTNVIPYDKKTLLIHEVGHAMFDPKTALPLNDEGSKKRLSLAYTELENAIMGKSTEDPSVFSLETHPRRKLSPAGMRKAGKILSSTIDAIDNIVSDFGLNDSNTIQDLVMVQVGPIIDNFGLTEDRNRDFILRLMKLCRSLKDPRKLVPCGTKDPKTGSRLHEPPINIRNLTAGLPQELSDEIKQFDKNFSYQDYTAGLSNSLYEFTNAILQDFESSFISDNEKAIRDLQSEISQSIKKIKNSSNEIAKKNLEKQLAKLQNVKNVNTPSEGFVFNFNGVTYKFTGAFAPSNQILGMERYERFGPIKPQEGAESPLESDSRPRIAIVPGAFKPPHKGHLAMVERLAEVADKVIVIISRPTKAGRALPSGKVVDSNHAEQIWRGQNRGHTISGSISGRSYL
jgi:cytidyltransferase-like protein